MSRPARPASGADTDRAIADLVREGVVDSVNLDAGKAIVRLGDILTPPIDWLCSAGETRTWNPPAVGEQVVVVSPEGDIERAFIVGGLPSSVFAPLFLGVAVGIEFKDAGRIIYDPASSRLELQLPGAVQITAPDGVSIEADVTIKGDVQVDGDVRATGTVTGDNDVVFAGKSAKAHKHLSVTPGTGVSGTPQ